MLNIEQHYTGKLLPLKPLIDPYSQATNSIHLELPTKRNDNLKILSDIARLLCASCYFKNKRMCTGLDIQNLFNIKEERSIIVADLSKGLLPNLDEGPFAEGYQLLFDRKTGKFVAIKISYSPYEYLLTGEKFAESACISSEPVVLYNEKIVNNEKCNIWACLYR